MPMSSACPPSPFSAGRAESVCKQVRHRCPKVKIVLGLWEISWGRRESAREGRRQLYRFTGNRWHKCVSVGNQRQMGIVEILEGDQRRVGWGGGCCPFSGV
jgi:hypothetical protein